jgi:DNA polymerase III subunit delta'
MAFADFAEHEKAIELLQRSLERGRLAHGYLFCAHKIEHLEDVARTLAKTLNCQRPVKKSDHAIDCCDECLACRKIQEAIHPDVHWVRPESKTRVIKVEQMRELMQQINLKPNEAEFKVAVVVGADRLNTSAANAFLKTLEEPPPKSILILLTTDGERILETIASRCLRLSFAGDGEMHFEPAELSWLGGFAELAGSEQKSLIGRYRLMDRLLKKLAELKTGIDGRLTASSPLQRYQDAEKDLQEKWAEELKAAIEAEYRRQRSGVLGIVQWWLRDIWLQTLNRQGQPGQERGSQCLLTFPQVTATAQVAERISAVQAAENLQTIEELQGWLHSNVQEALALEVGLLKLNL